MKQPKVSRMQQKAGIDTSTAQRFRDACKAARDESIARKTQITNLVGSAARELGAEFDEFSNEWDFECSCGAIICIAADTGIVIRRKGERCESLFLVTDFVTSTLQSGIRALPLNSSASASSKKGG